MHEDSQTVQNSSYKINKSWGCNVQHREYSQEYYDDFVRGQRVTRLTVGVTL